MTTAHLPCIDAAKTIRNRQQGDAKRVLERLQRVDTPDLTISYTLHKSAVVLPGVLVRFIALAVLFRLDSPKKWRLALSREILPETARQWLGIQDLTDLVEQANVDWIPPATVRGYTQLARYGMPDPVCHASAERGHPADDS